MKIPIYAMFSYRENIKTKPRRSKSMIMYVKKVLKDNGFVNPKEIEILEVVNIRKYWTLKIKFY